ncbi:glycosyltransferase family 4 protein [Shewanella baltica]|uniref:glycosyltransferase family 4 protein n=1 Tax=Shewanella baltica TaxID=62322 RepID=UPI000DFDE8A5|nr:glycosyltransferase [Shewanella baltica]SUI48672.1 UDP-D-galactose:(glucosyl)lipopolysaccharide-1,6-D-galactosyltransferase [Shewanella baltica]
MQGNKTSVLVFAPHFSPAFKAGGVVKTLIRFIDMLKHDISFTIISSDRDIGDTSSFKEVKVNRLISKDAFSVAYSNGFFWYFYFICKIILFKRSKYDYIYLNGLFSLKYSIIPLVVFKFLLPSTKIVCAIRGESSDSALAKSNFKKYIFLKFINAFGLYKNIIFQATSESERSDFISNISTVFKDIYLVQDPVSMPLTTISKIHSSKNELNNVLTIALIGRISAVKNIDFALKILKLVKSEVALSIFGPIEDYEYWEVCLRIVKTLPKNVTVIYEGALSPDDLYTRLSSFDLLLHPSKGENFGHVIYEALSLGVPVLISDKTPWVNLEKLNIGWDVSLGQPDKFAYYIDAYSVLEHNIRNEMKNSALKYAYKIYSNSSVNQNMNLFSW